MAHPRLSLPAPALCERRHSGLTRRLVVVRRRAHYAAGGGGGGFGGLGGGGFGGLGGGIGQPQFNSLDHLVGTQQERLGNRQTERLRGLEVDHQFKFRWQLDRQIGR